VCVQDIEQLLNYIGGRSLGPRHVLANLKELLRIILSSEYIDTSLWDYVNVDHCYFYTGAKFSLNAPCPHIISLNPKRKFYGFVCYTFGVF